MQLSNKIRIAIQRSGRLAEGSLSLLEKCGIDAKAVKNKLLIQNDSFGIDFIFARDDDIPGLVESNICELGIIGENLLEEYCGHDPARCDTLQVIMPLGFSNCKLSIACSKTLNVQSIQELNGKVIATSYPNILRHFLNKEQINAQIVTMHGSVELAPQIGIADLICDLVSSGATLNENGLQELIPVRQSQAVLLGNKTELNEVKQGLIDKLILRIKGVLTAKRYKYITLHIDREKLPLLTDVLPGSESPTITELNGMSGKVAVHVVSQEDIFWETIEKLKSIGSSSILVLPIEKMVA